MDLKDIDAIFKKLGGNFKIRVEFEGAIQRNLYEKIVERFIYKEENGGLNSEYIMKTRLIIKSPNTDYFLDIDGKNEVKRYWLSGDIPPNSYKMEKLKQNMKVTRYGLSLDLFEYDVKDVEKTFTKNMENDAVKKEYRYQNIFEIVDPKWKFLTLMIEQKRVESGKKFKESDCLTSTPTYHIEILFPEDIDLSDKGGEEMGESAKFSNYFNRYLVWLLEEVQQTNFIISQDEKKTLLDSFKKLTRQSDVRSENFILAEPVEVLRRNFHDKDRIPNVRNDYAVSYQPSGDPMFLFIAKNFSKNVDGKIFMITRNFEIINTGKMVDGFENSLLEGYYSETNNLFYITDIIFYKGNDIRGNKFFMLGGGSKEKFRFDYLLQFYKEAIQPAKYIDSELRDEATKIVLAKYLFGNGPKFEENVNELFDKVKLQDFTVSGLQFRPMNEYYPEKGGHWYSLFKWNYPQFRTADFLVKYRKDDDRKNDKISPFQLPSKGKDLYGKIIYYKTLELKVGGYREVKDKKIVTPVDFLPSGTDPDSEINFANIPLNDAGKVVAEDFESDVTEEIEDNSIVTFTFQKKYGEFTSLFKWSPIRVDHSKTVQMRNGEEVYGMTETYANHVWNALTNVISETNLREGTVPEEDISTAYYANNSMRLKKFPFQVFHNRIVKDNLIAEVCPAIIKKSKTMLGSLLDLACGTGGDMMKWKIGLLKDVVGMDISKENIDIALSLYRKARRPKPDVTYIWGNSSHLIFPNFDAGMDNHSKDIMKRAFLSKFQFDVVSIQFAIHYMFESEITIRTLLQNVTDNLKVGGYFIGTSLDGERVYELLKGQDKAEGLVGDDLLWKIQKNYELKKWEKSKPNVGHEIEVFVSTIGIQHKEFLVNYEYLKDLAKEYGLEMVSIRGFGEIYEDAIKAGSEYDEDLKNMSIGEKIFSFLHNEFKFIKRKDASDNVYKKLMDLISKKAKKDEKLSKFEGSNKRFTIKVRSGGAPVKN